MSLNDVDVEDAAMTWLGELGYPSNLQDDGVKTVPQQAELMCEVVEHEFHDCARP